MKNFKTILLVLLLSIFVVDCSKKKKKGLLLLPGMTGGTEETSSQGTVSASVNGAALSNITINPSTKTIYKDTITSFTAVATYTDGTVKDVTESVVWSVENNSVSESTDKKGKFKAISQGTTKVKAFHDEKEGFADLIVSTASIQSISILPNTGNATNVLHVGTETKYTVTIVLSDGTVQDITEMVEWSAVGSSIQVSNGVVSGVSEGSSTIKVTLKDPNNPSSTLISGQINVVVSSSPLQSLQISGHSNPPKGLSTGIQVIGVFADGTTQNLTSSVTLTSSDPSVVSIQNGANITLVGTQIGSSVITASFGNTNTTINISVTDPVVQSISIESQSNSISAGYGTSIKAIALMSDGSTRDVTDQIVWTSSDASILTITNGVNGGVINTISTGSATITASLFDSTANYNFTVNPATLVSLSVSNNNSIPKGLANQYQVIGTYSDGSTQDLTSQVVWTSSNTNVATVSNQIGSNGVVSAINVGSSTITASISGIEVSKQINITSAILTSISISPNNISLAKGLSQQFIATGTYSDGSTQTITNSVVWASNNNSVALVSNSSPSNGLLTAVSVGTVTIQATKNGVNSSVQFTTSPATIVSLSVLSSHDSVAKGLHEQFQAFATYTDGTIVNVTSQVIWSSSNTNVAIVSNLDGPTKGNLTSLSTGSTNIIASLNGISSQKTVTVSPAVLTSISIQSNDSSTSKGLSQQFIAIGHFSDGTTLDITRDVTWVADSNNDGLDDNLVVSISNATSPVNTKGLASTNSTGPVNIIASYNGISSTVKPFEVTPARIQTITISPLVVTIQVGSNVQFVGEATFSDGSVQVITQSLTFKADSNNDGIDDNSIVAISNLEGSKGRATAINIGSATILASYNGITSSANVTTTESVSTTVTIDDKNITVPNGVTTGTPPTGDYSGIVYNGGTNLAGSVSIIPDYGQTTCTTLGSHVLNMILNDTPDKVATSTQVSNSINQTIDGCSVVYNLSVTTSSNMKPTELSNHLITVAGTNRENGVVSSLPSNQTTEISTNDFRVIIQITYSSAGSELIGIGVSSATEYTYNESILDNFLDGTNVTPAGTVYLSQTDSFVGTPDPKVDFLWVVDNSGSMSGEQASLQNAATTFFNKLGNKHLDYKLGVITTGSDGSCSRNLSNHPSKKAWLLWGPNGSTTDRKWVGASDGINAFTSRVNVGLGGCGDETGTFFAKYALEGGHVKPRTDSKLVIVMVSDEGDYYQCFTGGSKSNDGNGVSPTFNPCAGGTPLFGANDSNYFKTNNHKVYSIIGLNPSTNLPGTCKGSGNNSANTSNNRFDNYYRLAQSTGGSSASICTDDFNPIMNSITTNAAGSSSSYVLNKVPQSSTIYVKVNGSTIQQNSTDGWIFNSSSNSIVFSGSAWPLPGSNIEISYQFDPTQVAFNEEGSMFLAFLKRSANTPITLIVMIGLISTTGLFLRRKYIK
jgi:hypothetical protein